MIRTLTNLKNWTHPHDIDTPLVLCERYQPTFFRPFLISLDLHLLEFAD